MLKNASESEQYAMQVPSTEGVYFVPAFVGLGTPYWDSEARGAIFGLTRGTTKEHFIRAALESIAFQSKEVMDVMIEEACLEYCRLAADGGATENKFLMQFQADLLQCSLQLPYVSETTALGAAYLAGLAVGFYNNLDEIKLLHRIERLYEPQMDVATVNKLVQGWKRAVACTLQYK
jgi:glycerol kinase